MLKKVRISKILQTKANKKKKNIMKSIKLRKIKISVGMFTTQTYRGD